MFEAPVGFSLYRRNKMTSNIISSAMDYFSLNSFSGSSHEHKVHEEPRAKSSEISWNGYPLPRGLRINDNYHYTPQLNDEKESKDDYI